MKQLIEQEKPQKKSQEKRVEKEGFCKDGKLRKERSVTVFTGIRDQPVRVSKKRPIEAYVSGQSWKSR